MTPARVRRDLEVMEDSVAEVLRRKTGAERLRIASDIYARARRMLHSYLRQQHPDWSNDQIMREAARRLSHGAA